MDPLYNLICNTPYRTKLKENNDCSVIATTIVTGEDYPVVHDKYKEAGRKTGRGVQLAQIKQVTGKKFDAILKPNGSKYTARTIAQAFPTGRYLIFFNGHVAAMVDGKIHDLYENRCARVIGYIAID